LRPANVQPLSKIKCAALLAHLRPRQHSASIVPLGRPNGTHNPIVSHNTIFPLSRLVSSVCLRVCLGRPAGQLDSSQSRAFELPPELPTSGPHQVSPNAQLDSGPLIFRTLVRWFSCHLRVICCSCGSPPAQQRKQSINHSASTPKGSLTASRRPPQTRTVSGANQVRYWAAILTRLSSCCLQQCCLECNWQRGSQRHSIEATNCLPVFFWPVRIDFS